MSKMSYLVVITALLAIALVASAAGAVDYKFYDKSWSATSTTPPGWTFTPATSQWGWGFASGIAGDPDTTPTGGNFKVIGLNLLGSYAHSTDQAAITPLISCTGRYNVRVVIDYWLTVGKWSQDQAYVSVTGNGNASSPTWTDLWTSATVAKDAAVTVGSWQTFNFNLRGTADNNANVALRFRIKAGADNADPAAGDEYGGWNIRRVRLYSAGDDLIADWSTSAGWILGTVPAGGPAGNAWQFGTPAPDPTTSGQVDATDPTKRIGSDPTVDPDGGTASIFGYNLGGNYQKNLTSPIWLTSPAVDCTAKVETKLRYKRWLNVEAPPSGSLTGDYASLEATNADQAAGTQDALLSDDFEAGVGAWTTTNVTVNTNTAFAVDLQSAKLGKAGEMKKSISTTAQYDLVLTYRAASGDALNPMKLQYTLDGTKAAADIVWVDVASIANTAWPGADASATFATWAALPACNNAKFAIRFVTPDVDGAIGYVDNVKLVSTKWTRLWTNTAAVWDMQETAGKLATDAANWVDTVVGLKSFGVADGHAGVMVRFGQGPSDNFAGASEFGGWNLAQMSITDGNFAYSTVSAVPPKFLAWGKSGNDVVTAKNEGTVTWTSDTVTMYPVESAADDKGIAQDPNPSPNWFTEKIDRWASISGTAAPTTAPGANGVFTQSLVAPKLDATVYPLDADTSLVLLKSPADPTLSTLSANFNIADVDSGYGYALTGATIFQKADGTAVKAETMTPASEVPTFRFPDVTPGSAADWAKFYIGQLAGYYPFTVKGVNGNYAGADSVTRGSMCVFLSRALGLDLSIGGPTFGDAYKDVNDKYWAVKEIEAMSTVGLARGYPGPIFSPDNVVTRDQMAVFMARSMEYDRHPGLRGPATNWDTTADILAAGDVTKSPPVFSDVPGTGFGTSGTDPFWAFHQIMYLNKPPTADAAGGAVVTGVNGKYYVSDPVTRASLAVFVWRAFIRDNTAAVVAVGGPGMTYVNPATVDAYGYPDKVVERDATKTNYAYVVLDAVRLQTPTSITFELLNEKLPTHVNFTQVVAYDPAADHARVMATGYPYATVAVPVLVGSGNYTLNIRVGTKLSSMQPGYYVCANIAGMADDFSTYTNTTLSGTWILSGAVTVPDKGFKDYELGTHTGVLTGQGLLVKGGQSAIRAFNTTGYKNMRASFLLTTSKLAATENVKVDVSPDAGITWVNLKTISGAVAADAKDFNKKKPYDKYLIDFPAAANNNPNVWFKVSCTGSASTAWGYFDSLIISGSGGNA